MTQAALFPSAVGDGMRRWAEFSPCASHGPLCAAPACEGRRFRYLLGREWGTGIRVAGILCNPSTASADPGPAGEDPTSRKFIGFAKRLGAGSCEIGNPFNYRATDPKELKAALRSGVDCVGPRGNEALLEMVARADRVIVGWGANGAHRLLRPRIAEVLELLRGREVFCFGVGADGAPNHPLMLWYDTPLVPFKGAA